VPLQIHAYTQLTSLFPSAIPSLNPGQWRWTGDLFVTTQEPISAADGDEDGKPKTKSVHHRACEVVIRDPVIPNEQETKIFTSTLELYVKGKITIQNTFDLHLAHAELGAGAFEPTQAGWMIRTDKGDGADLELWRGVIRKMETSILVRLNVSTLMEQAEYWDLVGHYRQNILLQ
jgi:hypothetical protein